MNAYVPVFLKTRAEELPPRENLLSAFVTSALVPLAIGFFFSGLAYPKRSLPYCSFHVLVYEPKG